MKSEELDRISTEVGIKVLDIIMQSGELHDGTTRDIAERFHITLEDVDHVVAPLTGDPDEDNPIYESYYAQLQYNCNQVLTRIAS